MIDLVLNEDLWFPMAASVALIVTIITFVRQQHDLAAAELTLILVATWSRLVFIIDWSQDRSEDLLPRWQMSQIMIGPRPT